MAAAGTKSNTPNVVTIDTGIPGVGPIQVALDAEAPSTSDSGSILDTIEGLAREGVQYVKAHPTEVGALAGGIAAVPLTGGTSLLPAIAAAGLGGVGGAGLGMLADAGARYLGLSDNDTPLPDTALDVAKTLGEQGAAQAAGELGGRAVAGAFTKAGNALMHSTIPRRIAQEFPAAAETLNRYAVNPTRESGTAKIAGIRRRLADRAQTMLARAEAAGTPAISAGEVAPFLDPALHQARAEVLAGRPGAPGLAAVGRRLNALFDAQPTGDIALRDVPVITRALQDEGMTARLALEQGALPTEVGAITADNLAAGVRQVARRRVPGFEAANKALQGAIGAERAAKALEHAPIPLGAAAWRLYPSILLGAGEYYRSQNPLAAAAAMAAPLAVTIPQVAAPTAIGLYRAGKLPYALLAKVVAPEVLKGIGITPEDAPAVPPDLDPDAVMRVLMGQDPTLSTPK